ncbi:MAG: hypothetical protein JNJ83_14750 [Verrucomicrobiaceae bacterium]|nr:hypothetical protein [Verrucomicrobiaceae bacterium]
MVLNSVPPRYVIGADPPAARPKIRVVNASRPAAKLPPEPSGGSITGIATFLFALVCLAFAIAAVWHLTLERDLLKAEKVRAESNADIIDSLSARLTVMAAERERLYQARTELLDEVDIAKHETKSTAESASAWARAHDVARSETFQVAYRWQDHSLRLEAEIGDAQKETADANRKLDEALDEARRTEESLAEQIRVLDQEAVGYKRLARQLESDASGLRSTISSLESCISSLRSENSSLSRENSSLSSQVSSLQSEVSSLRCQSHTCSRCGHR